MRTHPLFQTDTKQGSSFAITVALHLVVFALALQASGVINTPKPPPVTATLKPQKPIERLPEPALPRPPQLPPLQTKIDLPPLDLPRHDPETPRPSTSKSSEGEYTGGPETSGVGSGISTAKPVPVHIAAHFDANACAKPEYPLNSLRNQEEGTVNLAMLIGTNGKVLEAKVEKSSGYKALDKAALQALSLCQFTAGSVDGIPEKSWAKLQYVWTIQ